MTQEPNPGERGNQPGKPATYKRSNRSGRNRPVLVTSTTNETITDVGSPSGVYGARINSPAPSSPTRLANDGGGAGRKENEGKEEIIQETTSTTSEAPRTRRLPKFFSTVGKSEQVQEPQEVAISARLARAIGGKVRPQAKESKPSPAREGGASPAPTTRSAPTRPAGLFKMRYIWGMMLYLISADVIGVFVTNLLRSNGLDGLVAQIGPLVLYRSTILFLLTLVILLVILARFDLIPRNLGAFAGQSTQSRNRASSQNTSESGSAKSPAPTMKQGVKGEDDDLYQEYRAQQRYNQRRERKR